MVSGLALHPQTRKQWRRFRSLRRGYYSAIGFFLLVLLSCGAEMLANSRALIVHYDGQYYFPTYGAILPGTTFGLDYPHETNYRDLQQAFATQQGNNWLLMPVIPWNAFDIPALSGH